MIAIDFLSDEIPPLKTSDTGSKVLQWMDEFKTRELPVLENGRYIGLITEADVLDMNAPDTAIGEKHFSLERPYIYANQHIYDVFNIISEQNLSLIPVLNEEDTYVGVITLSSLVKSFAQTAAVRESGSIITLELNANDYALSEIAKIVESDNAKILSLYIQSTSNSTKMDVTLKINKTDISRILQTFFRFDYVVKASFQQAEFYEDLKKRYDEFMRFLNT